MSQDDKGQKKEIDADEFIRQYEERQELTEDDLEAAEQQEEFAWYEQAQQDTAVPADAVLTGGDIDAAWDQASVGDETVGGSSPTPDQDIVDEIGRALGVTYAEGEPLHTTEKIERRDAERWELNPASSEDYNERIKSFTPPEKDSLPLEEDVSSKRNERKAA